MRIVEPEPPADSARALMQKMERLNRNKAIGGRAMEAVPIDSGGERPILLHAHRHYVFSANQILQGYDFREAEAPAWRYVMPQESGGTSVAEVFGTGEGEHRVAEISEGLHSQLVRQTIDWLEEQDLGSEVFELRSLSVPSLLVDSIWLYSTEGESRPDYFTPIQPVNQELNPFRLYSRDEFMNNLRLIAERFRLNALLSQEG